MSMKFGIQHVEYDNNGNKPIQGFFIVVTDPPTCLCTKSENLNERRDCLRYTIQEEKGIKLE